MKLYKNITGILLGGLLFAGCSLDYEYLNGPSSGTFPATKDEAYGGLYAAYKNISALTFAGTPIAGVFDNVTDIGASRGAQTALINMITSNISTEASQVSALYKAIYKTAGRANLVLDNLDRLRDQLSDEEYNALKVELLLVRDYYYEIGAQMFGDMIFADHCLTLSDYLYPRSAYMSNVHRIIDELPDDIIDCLPVQHDKSRYCTARLGRVGAYGLKARFALHWAHEDPALWAEAARCAHKALELAKGVYELEPYDISFCGEDHSDAGEPSAANLFGLNGHANSREWIWASQYNKELGDNTADDKNTHNASNYAAPRTLGGADYYGPTQAFIDAIQCIDGKSILESALYDYAHPWKNRDPRLDLFCLRPGARIMGVQFETSNKFSKVYDYNQKKEISNMDCPSATKGEYGPNASKGPAGYLWRKYLDKADYERLGNTFSNNVNELSYPLMRLAELYLTEAEANIEMENGDLALAREDINVIRRRAHMPEIKETSREGLRKALRYERMVELCNEGFRWFDIRRWQIDGGDKRLAEKVMNEPIYAPGNIDKYDGMLPNGKPVIDENWHCSYDPTRTWDGKEFNMRIFKQPKYDPEKDIHWPIPAAELRANPLIEQNPHY